MERSFLLGAAKAEVRIVGALKCFKRALRRKKAHLEEKPKINNLLYKSQILEVKPKNGVG